jgi:hypothetical protein
VTPPLPREQVTTGVDARLILKYDIDPATGAQHAIPNGSRFLSLQVQNGVPVMWWSVPAEPGFPNTWPLRAFSVVPTGLPGYIDGLAYVGTFQLGAFVGHVFAWESLDA